MLVGSHKTDIHLVSDFESALGIAYVLEAGAVALDVEGVLGNYVGNEPYPGMLPDFFRGKGEYNVKLASAAILNNQDIAFGLATNNTNKPNTVVDSPGLVSLVAGKLEGIPFVHKGMQIGGVVLGSKPSGDQTKKLCEIVEVSPENTVLIDDQGVKNAGEAVKAGLKAIIVPHPIGLSRQGSDRVIEHTWVGRARRFEPLVYDSLEKQGRLARFAYHRLAGIDISSIGVLFDHRV
jgi:hypothetical protein